MSRDFTIDIARSISMLYIIAIWHLSGYTDSFSIGEWGEYVKNAALGLFMFISSYLLSQKYLIINFKDLSRFIKKRITRIIPLFALSLILLIVTGAYPIGKGLLSLIGLTSFCIPQPPTLWFMSMIVFFYYLFIILNRRKILLTVLIALIMFSLFNLLLFLKLPIDHRLLYYFPCFAMGIILKKYSINQLTSYVLIIFYSAPIVFIVTLSSFNITILTAVEYKILVSCLGALLLLFIAKLLSKSKMVCKISSITAYASLAAYLFHRPILSIIREYIYWPEDGVARLLFLIIVCIPIIMIFGYTIQLLYDDMIKSLNL